MVPAHLVAHDHVEGGCGRSFLDVAVDVEAISPVPSVDDLVERPGIAVERHHHICVLREQLGEGGLRQSVRVHVWGEQHHQVHHVHHPHA